MESGKLGSFGEAKHEAPGMVERVGARYGLAVESISMACGWLTMELCIGNSVGEWARGVTSQQMLKYDPEEFCRRIWKFMMPPSAAYFRDLKRRIKQRFEPGAETTYSPSADRRMECYLQRASFESSRPANFFGPIITFGIRDLVWTAAYKINSLRAGPCPIGVSWLLENGVANIE